MEFLFGVVSKSVELNPAQIELGANRFEEILSGRRCERNQGPFSYLCRSGYEEHFNWQLNTGSFEFLVGTDLLRGTSSEGFPLLDQIESGELDDPYSKSGNFLAGYYDSTENQLLIESDRFGTVPLFYYENREFVAFCSFAEVLSCLGSSAQELSHSNIAEFLRYGFLSADKTFYKNIHSLPTGSQLISNKGEVNILKYESSLSKFNIDFESIKEVAETYFEEFSKATSQLLRRSQTNYALLTGGTDTRLILSSLEEGDRKSLQFVTFFDPIWSANNNDAEVARELAERFNLSHEIRSHKVHQTYMESIRSKESLYKSMVNLPSKLCGTFGSESVGGASLRLMPSRPWTEDGQGVLSVDLIREIFSGVELGGFSEVWQNRIGEVDVFEEYSISMKTFLRSSFSSVYSGVNALPWSEPFQLRLSQKLMPFINCELLELLTNLPRSLLVDYKIQKYIFKNIVPEFKEIPFQSRITNKDKEFVSVPWHGELEDECLASFDLVVDELAQNSFFDHKSLMSLKGSSDNNELKRRLTLLFSWLQKIRWRV